MKGSSHGPMDPLEPLELGRCSDILGPPTKEELERGLDGFLARVRPNQPHRRREWRRYSLAVTAAALSILVAVVQGPTLFRKLFPAHEAASLAYRVEGGSELESGYLRESGHDGVQVLFSEGSRFDLIPGARGRIRAVDKQGAHLAVERGTASLRIVPGEARRWLVDVGPFLVTVKGTAFTVSWDPSSEQFELRLRRGRVVVKGPVSSGEIDLRAGQRLVVNLAKAETIINEERPQESEGPIGAVVPSAAPSIAAGTAPSSPDARPPAENPAVSDSDPALQRWPAPARMARLTGEQGWREQLARGNWDRILDDVKRFGVNETLSQASSEDLFALANAARYRHQLDLARAALLAERRRFPGSPRALGALYLLGRVEESRDTRTAQAIAWYDEYLARAPTGPLVGEALGRKMILTEKLEGPARARAVAEDYLRRFPKGNYAGSARELVASP
jgi:TolA-binding protein